MTTREKLDAVYALDEKRTQLGWTVESIWAQTCGEGFSIEEQRGGDLSQEHEANQQYIAAAPTMVSLLRELEARIKVLGKALATCGTSHNSQGYYQYFDEQVVHEALAAADLDKDFNNQPQGE